MILKYFEISKINFDKTNFLLFHGKNEGYKSEEIKKIKEKLKIKITDYDEKQVLENTDNFFEKTLNKSFFEEKEIILINRCSDKITKVIEDLVKKGVNDKTLIFNSEILDKKSKLRNLFEKSKSQLVSVAFYPDTNEILSKVAQKVFRERKISLSGECINLIVDKCAGDRKNLFNEIDKIQLYLKDKNIIKDQINAWSIEKIKNLIFEINNIELQIKKNSYNAINFTTNFLLEKSN